MKNEDITREYRRVHSTKKLGHRSRTTGRLKKRVKAVYAEPDCLAAANVRELRAEAKDLCEKSMSVLLA